MSVFRWASFGLTVALTACTASGAPADRPTTTTSVTQTTTTTHSTSTSTAPITSTTSPPAFEAASLPQEAEMVISSEDGIFFKLTGDGDRLAQLWDQPTAIAFMIGDDLVAAQRASSGDVYPPFADGPIVVFDPSGRRDLDRGEERLVLLDTGVVDGHPVALATSETGSGPEDTDERLLLIGLPSGERTDLGSVAGWESTVVQARLTPQGVVLLIDGEGRRSLIARSLDGNVQWELPLSDQVVTLKDSELILVLPGFTGGSFTPVVTLARHDVSTGSELGAQEMTLRPALDYRIQGGFCFTADWIDETLVCDQTYGAPLLIEPSGDVSLVNGVDGGVATVVRRHSSSSG